MHIFGLTIERTNKTANPLEYNGVRLSPAEQLAHMQAENAAGDMMATIRWAKRIAWVLLVGIMAVSYEDQHFFLVSQHMRPVGAAVTPILFDLATVFCVMVIGAAAMKKAAKIVALCVVVLPTLGSGFINVLASPTHVVAVVMACVVCLIPAVELIKALMGANLAYMRQVESELSSAARPVNAPARAVSDEEREYKRAAAAYQRYQKMNPAAQAKWRARNGGTAPRKPVKGSAKTTKVPANAPTSPGMPPVTAWPELRKVPTPDVMAVASAAR
jgi:hypothetical protein